MKAFIILLLVFSILGGIGFGIYYSANAPKDVYDIAAESKPTKVTTEVNYVTADGDTLNGFYVTTVDGNDTQFEYEYQRLYTPAESVAEGTNDRIKNVSGVIYYRDGVYSGDQGEWKPGVGTALELKLNISEKLLKDIELNEDGTVLTAKLTPENAIQVIGTDIRAVEDIDLTVETNGVNLTMVTIHCYTQYGEMTVRTSFTYGEQNLFADDEAAK